MLYANNPKIIIPEEEYQKYFNAIGPSGKLYICVIIGENEKPSVYMEPSDEKDDNLAGIVRVFYKISDISIYLESVADSDDIDDVLVQRWETKCQDLVKHLSLLDLKSREDDGKGIKAIGSTIIDNEFADIDVFWTSEPKIMV